MLDILFVEDNPSDHLLTEHALRRAGVLGRSLRVESEPALRDALATHRWDMVVSDYSVPGMRFTDTLALLLRDHPGMPLILLSATVGDSKAAVLLHLGARAYLPKSRLKDLAATIERVMGQGGRSPGPTTSADGAA